MSFLEITNKMKPTTTININSLQTRPEKHHKPTKKNIPKRMSPVTPKKAVITVEASIAIPLFLFAVISILSFLDILRIQMNLDSALHQVASEMAVYGFAADQTGNGNLAVSTILSETYVRKKVNELAGKEYLDNSCIHKGSGGISYLGSRIMEQDKIVLRASYQVDPVVPVIGFQSFTLSSKACVRAYTGYDVLEKSNRNEEEEIVFITETGTAYHKNRNCTHLVLSISGVSKEKLPSIRNEEGGNYKPCEVCCGKKRDVTEYVFITNFGDRYHVTPACSGIKRTVIAIPISKTENRTECTRCR